MNIFDVRLSKTFFLGWRPGETSAFKITEKLEFKLLIQIIFLLPASETELMDLNWQFLCILDKQLHTCTCNSGEEVIFA